MTQVCPVVGTTTTVLPPDHPAFDHNDPEARCPITNAKVEHHETIHNHPGSKAIPHDKTEAMDATSCPALKHANDKGSLTESTCPVVGPVSAYLPPTHPALTEKEAGSVCPVTNATLSHHKNKVHEHPSVANDASAAACPVAGANLKV